MLTPLDFQDPQFSKEFRGYSVNEVRRFLEEAANEFESLREREKELRAQVGRLQDELEKYRQWEDTLQRTLVLAEQSAQEARSRAEAEAQQTLAAAEKEARALWEEARDSVRKERAQAERLRVQREVFEARVKTLVGEFLHILGEDEAAAAVDFEESV